MKYLPDCVLRVIFPSMCLGTIWQMPLIVSLLVPEGRYRYLEIRFLWIKKPQYIQYCPIVLLWSNNWIILFFLGSFPFFFSHPSIHAGGQKLWARSQGRTPHGPCHILIAQLGPSDLHRRTLTHSICVHCGSVGFILFLCLCRSSTFLCL